jgi:FlaA1/EpsC-like NDP-sugar epimerase
VILGDSSILIPLLVWLARPALTETAGDSTTSYLWVFLAFAAWTFAANTVQAQEFSRISSRLKSPLAALCSLFLMLIFLTVLFYIRIGRDQVVTYVRPLAIFLTLAVLLLTCWRILMAEVVNLPAFRQRAVIVGVNKPGREVATEVMRVRHRNIDVVGYIHGISAGSEPALGQLNELPVLGGVETLRQCVEDGMIEKVIMALDYKENQELFRVALEGAQQSITLVPAAVVYENISGKIPLEHLGDQWYMALPEHQFLSPFYVCWRKAIDLVFGLSGLVLMGLVLPILGPLIKLDSRIRQVSAQWMASGPAKETRASLALVVLCAPPTLMNYRKC